MSIGELIYNQRKKLKLTLEDIGNAVGVSKSTVKKWESGYIANIKRDKIAALAKVLQISPVALINIESPQQQPGVFDLTEHEIKLINAYRAKPEMQASIDKLLDITDEAALVDDMIESVNKTAYHPIAQK